MKIEKESTNLSPEESFKEKVEKRMILWNSLIEDSGADEKTKKIIRDILNDFKNYQENRVYKSMEDAVYYTVGRLLDVIKQAGQGRDQANALFENLRDDIWAFKKEID